MNPTREQFLNAAKFAATSIELGLYNDMPWVLAGSHMQRPWLPHTPSEDAFRLLAKAGHWVAASSTRTHELAVRSGSVDAFFTARDSGDEVKLAEATFLLAAAIGATMGEKQ